MLVSSQTCTKLGQGNRCPPYETPPHAAQRLMDSSREISPDRSPTANSGAAAGLPAHTFFAAGEDKGEEFEPCSLCHGCQLFNDFLLNPKPCRLDSNLARYSPCSKWLSGEPYIFPVNLVTVDQRVVKSEVPLLLLLLLLILRNSPPPPSPGPLSS